MRYNIIYEFLNLRGGRLLRAKDFWLQYFPMGLSGVLIIGLGIAFGQPFYKMLPMLNTLVIMLLSANANRYSFLFGGLNSVLYGVVYFSEHIYFSAISSALISFPLQIFSFFNWKRRSLGKETRLARLNLRGRLIVLGATVAGYAVCYWLLLPFFGGGQQQVTLDIFLFVIGLVITVLGLLRYVETPYYNLISAIANLTMWILICVGNVANLNYVIMAAYSLFRVAQSVVTWTKQYRKGKQENAIKEA